MMPLQRPPEGTHRITWAVHAAPSQTPDHLDKGGRDICGLTEVNPKYKDMGGQEERLDFGGHVEAHR